MKKVLIAVVIVILVGGFFFIKGKKATPIVNSTILKVEARNIESNIFLNGTVKTEEMREITSESNEVIESIEVKIGDHVKKGDVLIIQNTNEIDNLIKAAEVQLEIENIRLSKLKSGSNTLLINNLESAKLSFEDSKLKMESEGSLLEEGIISKQQYDNSVLTYNSAKNQLENARYNLNSSSHETDLLLQQKAVEAQELSLNKLKNNLKKATILAPIDGTITQLSGLVGERPSGVLLTIANFDKNIITTRVSEADINKIIIGQPVLVTANSVKNKNFSGKISWISPDSIKVDGKKQAYVEVKVALDKIENLLRRNFSVNLKIQVNKKENVKSIKFEGIKTKLSGESYVSLLSSDGATKDIIIETGIEGEIYVEIISDQLSIGDEIMIEASPSTNDGLESLF